MDLDAIVAEVVASGVLSDVVTGVVGDRRLLSGHREVAGRRLGLAIFVGASLEWEVPEVILLERLRFGHLAHVNASGVVCTGRREAAVPDATRPAAVVVESLEAAIMELAKSFQRLDSTAIVDEFDAYWRDQRNHFRVLGHVSPTGPPRRLWVQKISKNNHKPKVVADNVEAYTGYYPKQPWCGDYHARGVFIPLRVGARVLPPAPGHRWTEADVRTRILPHVPAAHQAAVADLLGEAGGDELVVFSLPRTTTGHVLFGVWFDGVHGVHPLVGGGGAKHYAPFSLDRRDADYLRPRGGASADLHGRRVLVAGCGSVGAHVAVELARAGVADITLVDPEDLKPENIYRHDLGLLGVGYKKAEAMSASLRARYPYLSVQAHIGTIQGLVADDLPAVLRHEVLVLATGNVGVESAVSKLLFEATAAMDIVHCWVDPYGAGWHALHARPGTPGCIRCLFTHHDHDGLRTNRASFVDPDAEVDMDLAGCGARFTPFASTAAVRSAMLATEVVLDVLSGFSNAPELRSEKGSARSLRAAGHATTARYDFDSAGLALSFVNPRCPGCSR